MLKLPPNTNLSKNAISSMASTAAEFSDEVVQETDPILIDIFTRIERGETTHEAEIDKLFDNYLKYGRAYV